MFTRRHLLTAIFVLGLATAAFADIPKRPDPKPNATPAVDTYLSIHLRSDAKEAVLQIPRSKLTELREQLDAADRGGSAAGTSVLELTRIPTIASGILLSLALVFAGVWFARSRKFAAGSTKTAAIIAILLTSGAVATAVYANVGPPAEARSITGRLFSPAVHEYKFGSGKIKLEVTEKEGDLTLIVPDPSPTPSPQE